MRRAQYITRPSKRLVSLLYIHVYIHRGSDLYILTAGRVRIGDLEREQMYSDAVLNSAVGSGNDRRYTILFAGEYQNIRINIAVSFPTTTTTTTICEFHPEDISVDSILKIYLDSILKIYL